MTTPPVDRIGGVSQYFRALRPHWSDEVTYFTIGSRAEGERLRTVLVRIAGDTVRFMRAIRAGGYDVVHLNPSLGPKAALRDGLLLVAAKMLGRPTLVFVHGWEGDFEEKLRSRWRKLTGVMLNRADGAVVLGDDFVSRLRRLGYRNAVFVHSAPVDAELFDDASRHMRQNGRDGSFRILFLARIEKEKGIYDALDAFRILRSRYPFVRLTVAGDGPELNRARSLGSSDVTFLGSVKGSAKYAAFRSADAYLFPSYHEGLPISVLEAMAYGIPVITSRVGGLPDFFADGSMGFMSESRDPEVLAALVEKLIRDCALRARIGNFNRQYATEHFSGERIAAGLEDIYRAVLAGAH